MHRLLLRQLKRLNLEETSPPQTAEAWQQFLERIHVTYTESDQGRELLERSLAISSREMQEINAQLKQGIEAERALLDHEKRTRLIIDTALDAVIGMDAEGKITDWNSQAEVIFGWTREEALERDLSETIIPLRYREAHRRGLRHFMATGEGPVLNRRIEITGIRRDGSEFPVELAVTSLKVGESFIFNAFIEDITQRKAAEEDLRKAKDAAEAANKAKSEFLANTSHEIRTPMNGIMGMTELLLETDLTVKQRRFATTVYRSATTLLDIINNILDFSKIEAGKLELETIDFDLRETMEEAATLLAERAHAKGLELTCLIPESVPRALRGDPVRLRQILLNLISNAIKFTEQGEVTIRVDLLQNASEQVTLQVTVTDTGVGIAEEAQAHIFEAFAQEDGSTTRKFGGTGLGLAIVKQLVAMMQGTLGVTSSPGRGATFWFTLTFAKQGEQHAPAVEGRTDLSGLRVLVVDDSATNREVLHHQLAAQAIRDDLVPDGVTALARLRSAAASVDPFAIAILDFHMPEMDGITLARAIKTDPSLAKIQLVMLTSVGRHGEKAHAHEAGVSAYLEKPVRQSELIHCLRNLASPVQQSQPPLVQQPTVPAGRARLNARILLAEDNPVNTEVAVNMLEAFGCTIHVVPNGREALAALARGNYDLVLMDCHMPVMDGLAATRAIRNAERRTMNDEQGEGPEPFDVQRSALNVQRSRRVPIVAMTANAMKTDRERCFDAGMDDYMSKPFTQQQLFQVLVRWVGASQQSEGAGDLLTAAPVSNGTTPRGPSEPVTIDRKAWETLQALQREGQPDLLGQVMSTYLDHSRKLIETIGAAIRAGDAPNVRGAAHSLKSSSASVGASHISRLSADLEALAREGTLGRAQQLYELLLREYHAACAVLRDELQRRGAR